MRAQGLLITQYPFRGISVTVLSMLFVLCWLGSACADYQKALEAYNAGDYAGALREWRPLAEQGDASAQNNLGVMYENGQGLSKDYGQAHVWYRQAAEQGLPSAQANIGVLYENGLGVPRDYGQ